MRPTGKKTSKRPGSGAYCCAPLQPGPAGVSATGGPTPGRPAGNAARRVHHRHRHRHGGEIPRRGPRDPARRSVDTGSGLKLKVAARLAARVELRVGWTEVEVGDYEGGGRRAVIDGPSTNLWMSPARCSRTCASCTSPLPAGGKNVRKERGGKGRLDGKS